MAPDPLVGVAEAFIQGDGRVIVPSHLESQALTVHLLGMILGNSHQSQRKTPPSEFSQCRHLEYVQIQVLPGTEKIGSQAPRRIDQEAVQSSVRENFRHEELNRPRVWKTLHVGYGEVPRISELWRANRKSIAHGSSRRPPWIGGPSTYKGSIRSDRMPRRHSRKSASAELRTGTAS